jgi:hypothetical protein
VTLRCGGARLRDWTIWAHSRHPAEVVQTAENRGVAYACLRERRRPRLSRHVRPPTLTLPPGGRRQNGHVHTHTDFGEVDPGIPKHPAWGDLCRVDAARRAGHRSSLSSVLKQHFRARPMRTERRFGRCSHPRPERSVCVVLNVLRCQGSMRSTVPTRLIVWSNDAIRPMPVLSAHATRYASAKSRRSIS